MASVTLLPPKPPSDLIASALFLPLSSVSAAAHKGRKLRFVGQVLAFDPRSSLLLLSSPGPVKPFPTVLANLTISLLGFSPAVRDSIVSNSTSRRDNAHEDDEVPPRRDKAETLVNRERLRLDRGEWVTVVGWLEGDDPRLLRKVNAPPSYAAPIGLVLEAIFISSARPPPDDAQYPISETSTPPAVVDATKRRRRSTAADEDATPRPRRKR